MSDSVRAKSSQVLSLVPTNQQEFVAGQKCIIDVPPNIQFFKGSKAGSFLALDVLNTSTTQTRWALAGSGHSLISQIDIFSGSMAGGILLESLTNYAQISQIIDLYTHNDYTPLESKEGMRRPAFPYSASSLRDTGSVRPITTSSDALNAVNGQFSPISDTGVAKYVQRRICLGLKSGILNYFDEEKLVPNLVLGGIRLEITFAPADECLAKIAGVAGGVTYTLATDDGGAGLPVSAQTGTTVTVPNCTIRDSGLAVGNAIAIEDNVPTVQATTITALVQNGTDLEITTADAITNTNTAGFVRVPATGLSMDYRIKRAEYRCMEITPPDGMANSIISGGMKYQFRTWKHFIDTIPSSSRRHVVELQSVASRAKALISMFVDSDDVTDPNMPNHLAGVNSDTMSMNSYQYFIGNKLFPLRAVDPRVRSDKVLTQNEQVKAISATGRMPLSLGSSEAFDLDCYSSIFIIGRELARGDYSVPLRELEPQIRLGFSATRAFNVRVHTFVMEDNVIISDSSGLRVEY
jgi:hypothetical protein